MMSRWATTLLIACSAVAACKPTPAARASVDAQTPEAAQTAPAKNTARLSEADQVAALIDPNKLTSLGERGANPRILKITAILWAAKTAGKNPEEITRQAIAKIGWDGTEKGRLTAAAILRNLDIAERLGSTTPDDLEKMKRGRAPTVRRGPYAGDILSVDHIIPRSVAPALDNTIANLELMPLRLNQSKSDQIGDRQRSLAQKLHAAGLLADPGKVR